MEERGPGGHGRSFLCLWQHVYTHNSIPRFSVFSSIFLVLLLVFNDTVVFDLGTSLNALDTPKGQMIDLFVRKFQMICMFNN